MAPKILLRLSGFMPIFSRYDVLEESLPDLLMLRLTDKRFDLLSWTEEPYILSGLEGLTSLTLLPGVLSLSGVLLTL